MLVIGSVEYSIELGSGSNGPTYTVSIHCEGYSSALWMTTFTWFGRSAIGQFLYVISKPWKFLVEELWSASMAGSTTPSTQRYQCRVCVAMIGYIHSLSQSRTSEYSSATVAHILEILLMCSAFKARHHTAMMSNCLGLIGSGGPVLFSMLRYDVRARCWYIAKCRVYCCAKYVYNWNWL